MVEKKRRGKRKSGNRRWKKHAADVSSISSSSKRRKLKKPKIRGKKQKKGMEDWVREFSLDSRYSMKIHIV